MRVRFGDETALAQAKHVSVQGLCKRYTGQKIDALHNVDLHIGHGEIFGIIGRSGAGKSSLIRCLNRLEDPSSGTVQVNGVDISRLSRDELVNWRRQTGMIFQHFNLLSAKTVRENIELPLRVAGIDRAQRRRKVDELLALVGLEAHQHAWPARLSGGQKQRVGIARALVHGPTLLLCDEATSALDPETTRSILALLRDINRMQGITIVLITHEMDVIHDLCHQVAVLEQGRIIEQGPVWQVYGDPRHETSRILLKPERHELPDSLASFFTTQPVSARSRPLFTLRYNGQAAVPPLADILAASGAETVLIESALEWVQGRQVGELLLLGTAGQPDINPQLASAVEVKGYVTFN
ncbi:ATP-binding cassette domain-containing protein [Erwinia sp. 9145]|uniref:methionine ABC transporter ATP-binding protein n=1 Tax=Erwinia sp. 9145 TaxID=1500895 RepID=UPI0005524289|nr:ATP-binding cassette domain-containing protein [Erwinia sp. 9145]